MFGMLFFVCPTLMTAKSKKHFLKIFNPFEAVYIEGAIEVSCLALLQEKAKKCLRELLIINKELAQLSKLYIQ